MPDRSSSEEVTRGAVLGPSRRATDLVPFRAAVAYWLRLGFINFGGPAGQIAIMHDELVERKRWIGEGRFLHALNFCMLLPGPEAQQLAIYIGWLLNGTLGGIVAGVLFVLPAALLMLVLSWTYVVHGDVGWVAAVFYGLQAAVVALVAAALVRVGARALKNPVLVAVAGAAFAAIFLFRVPFPAIVGVAAVVGAAASRLWPGRSAPTDHDAGEETLIRDADAIAAAARPWRRSLVVATVGLIVWWLPLGVVIGVRGGEDTLSRQAVFFSQAAMVTFGGAYAVLSYINQAAVQVYGWLAPGQMVAGLGLAESTPGPLILVTEFVGFIGAYQNPGGLDPLLAGTLGAFVALWATFAPCFLWIFLGAPYIERVRGNRALDAALSAVTAAVVGVIFNLAVSFGLVALFDEVGKRTILGIAFPAPDLATMDGFAALLALAGFVALWRYRVNVLWIVGASGLAGLVYRAVA